MENGEMSVYLDIELGTVIVMDDAPSIIQTHHSPRTDVSSNHQEPFACIVDVS